MAENKVPITRLNKFFSEQDFDLDISMGDEWLGGDMNFTVVLYRVDRQRTVNDDVYGETLEDGIQFLPPVEFKGYVQVEQPSNVDYGASKISQTEPGNIKIGVYQKQLDELGIQISYGDYIGYYETETRVRYYTVVNDGRVISDNKHTYGGYKPFYRSIIGAPVNENDDYIKALTKKTNEYQKPGSKIKYDMNPEEFPMANGDMDKKAFELSDEGEDFNYEIGGLQIPVSDGVDHNEESIKNYYLGSSKTGNEPGGNALKSKANDRFHKFEERKTLNKLKNQSYKRVTSPVFNEKPGTEKGKGMNIKLESAEEKKVEKINEEFNKIKNLISYDRKTQ